MKRRKIRISGPLNNVGVCANLKGYVYICDYLMFLYKCPVLKYRYAVDVYTMVADSYNVCCDFVARAIRAATENAGDMCAVRVPGKYS